MTDLALTLSYNVNRPTHYHTSLTTVDLQEDTNPHLAAPDELDRLTQRGPVYNDRITYVARVATIEDARKLLRHREKSLAVPTGHFRVAMAGKDA